MALRTIENWLHRIPKVELHLHLEGAIPHAALWELVRKYDGDQSVTSLEELKRRFTYKDFPHFLEAWDWKNQFLREYEDFTFIAEAVALDLSSQNIRYVEAFYSPADFARHGLDTGRLTEAIRAGFDKAPGITVALVADLVRDFGPEPAARTLAEVSEVKKLGVVGVGIGGSEQDFPPEPFGPVFEQARRSGLHTSAHAGEAAGAKSIWGAVRTLRVDRLGHGTRAEEDEALVDYLAHHEIPLEMCPISNLRTGVVSSIADHPVRRYFDRGLVVTVNTDDPKMFGNSLAQEYRLLHEELGFSRGEIRGLILQGIGASWLSASRKRALTDEFRSDPAWEAENDVG
ncbi:MAG: adenosine deaminase [Spirochaetia bacterium]